MVGFSCLFLKHVSTQDPKQTRYYEFLKETIQKIQTDGERGKKITERGKNIHIYTR